MTYIPAFALSSYVMLWLLLTTQVKAFKKRHAR